VAICCAITFELHVVLVCTGMFDALIELH